MSGKLKYQIGAHSIIGDRETQQDYYGYHQLNLNRQYASVPVLPIYGIALADGVGGEVAGDVASRLATNRFLELLSTYYGKFSRRRMLRGAVTIANQSIGKSIEQRPAYTGMATTLVGAVLCRNKLHWISVGDSHLYLIRNGRLRKLNDDHSMGAWIDRNYALGNITKEQAENTRYRNVILSCLSGEQIKMIDLPKDPLRLSDQDRVLFASDGLDTLEHDEIVETSLANQSAQKLAVALTGKVSQKGRIHQDNTAVLVVDCCRRG